MQGHMQQATTGKALINAQSKVDKSNALSLMDGTDITITYVPKPWQVLICSCMHSPTAGMTYALTVEVMVLVQ